MPKKVVGTLAVRHVEVNNFFKVLAAEQTTPGLAKGTAAGFANYWAEQGCEGLRIRLSSGKLNAPSIASDVPARWNHCSSTWL